MNETEPLQSAVVEAPPAVEATPVTIAKTAVKLEMLDGDEVIQLSIKPSLWFIPLVSLNWLLMVGVLATGIALVMPPGWTREGLVGFQVLIGIAVVRIGIAMLQWASRLYVLTNRRVMRFRGVLNVNVMERRLAKISAVELHTLWHGRALRLGSIRMRAADAMAGAITRRGGRG